MKDKKKKILFLQNDSQRYSPSHLELRFAQAGLEVDYYWASNDEFPAELKGYSGALIYASPHGAYEDAGWIHKEHEILKELASYEIPMLGICFGSQILASALCGRDQVFVRPNCEVGFLWIDLHPGYPSDPLTRSLPEKVSMFVWHNDEVRACHADMRILGSTQDCPNHIWRFRDLPVWGIQGHPELTREQAQEFFQQHRVKLEKDGACVDDLIKNADEAQPAKALVNNFIDFCARYEAAESTAKAE